MSSPSTLLSTELATQLRLGGTVSCHQLLCSFGKEPRHERSEREISTKAEGIKLALQSGSIRSLRRMEGITEKKKNDIAPCLGIHGISSLRRKVFIHGNVFIEVLMATEIQGSNHQSFRSCSEMTRAMLLTFSLFLKHSSL